MTEGHKDNNLKKFLDLVYRRINRWIKKTEDIIVEKNILEKREVYKKLSNYIKEREEVVNYYLQIKEEKKGLYKITLRIDTLMYDSTAIFPYDRKVTLYPIDIGEVYTCEFFI